MSSTRQALASVSASKSLAQSLRTVPAYTQTADRAVHVKIHPQPRNLAESTEVLRVLRRFGEVVAFKCLKHEPYMHAGNTALAIYQNPASAQEIIEASPLSFEFGKEEVVKQKDEGSVVDTVQDQSPVDGSSEEKREWLRQNFALGKNLMPEPSSIATTLDGGMKGAKSRYPQQITKPFTSNPTPSEASATSLPFRPSPNSNSASSEGNGDKFREFQLTIKRSVLNHQAYIQRQYYYGGFRLDDKSIMSEDLSGRVPAKGMVDCRFDKGEMPLRVRMKREEGAKRASLRKVWEQGRREREREGRDDWSERRR